MVGMATNRETPTPGTKRETHAENFIKHLLAAPNQTLRFRDLMDLYRVHAGRSPWKSDVDRVVASVTDRVGYGLYRLKATHRGDLGPDAGPREPIPVVPGPLVSIWDVPCPECAAGPQVNCRVDVRGPHAARSHLPRHDLAKKVRRALAGRAPRSP